MNRTDFDIDFQLSLIRRGAERIIEESELLQKIRKSTANGRPLVVKLGADPTAPDLHLGHTVVFRKLRHFQDIGHSAVFLIGDFTGRIGDPTGRDQTRPPLTEEQVIQNARTYQQQIGKILNSKALRIVFNSSWLRNLSFEDIVRLTSWTTMAKLLEHNTFQTRFEHAESIRFNEMLYPFMQAYDSVALRADVELGGTDQTFNLAFGRDIQRAYGQQPQVCITMPILPGTDGKEKMSKSLGNYVGIGEAPYTIFEKLMRMVDENIVPYFVLLTDKPLEEISTIKTRLDAGSSTEFILQQKMDLAYDIVKEFHGEESAKEAKQSYGKVEKVGVLELEIPVVEIDSKGQIPITRLVVLTGRRASKSEARRLIKQGAVSLDNVTVQDIDLEVKLKDGCILKIGKTYIGSVILKGKNE